MRPTCVVVGVLTLILLVTVPVGGAPALKVGRIASYNLSVSITFSPPLCEASSSAEPQTIVYCPVIAMIPPTFNINGTLGWAVTGLTETTAVLNVTREVEMSSWESLTPLGFRSAHSFNESIDLATRIANLAPFVTPEMYEALQIAQSSMGMAVSAGTGWNTSANTITSDMMQRPAIYTIWWVNGPLQLNQTIPVLRFPTNVTGLTSVDLGSLGTRAAWTLVYNLALPSSLLQQRASGTTIPTEGNIQASFAFNYDQQSDLLLSASADIHIGYIGESTYQTSQCNTSTTSAASWCPGAGFSIQASLTLANTNLNLDERLGTTSSSDGSTATSGSGSGSGTGSGSGSGTGSGAGTGTGGYGQGSDSGSSSGSGSGSGTGANPGNIPQSTTSKPSGATVPWIYWIIGIVAIVIIATSLWAARRRTNRTSTALQPPI